MYVHETDQRYDEVTDLLQQNDDSRRSVVVLGVGPDQADHVHHWIEVLLKVLEVRLFNVLEVRTQRLQVEIDILSFRKSCPTQSTDWCHRRRRITAKTAYIPSSDRK